MSTSNHTAYPSDHLPKSGDPILELRRVWAAYHGEPVLEDVNLEVFPHDFVGIIGPNGGGKTTLLRVILGLLEPMQGEVRIFGKPPKYTRHRIGYVPQAVEFDRDFPISVWDVVRMGRLNRRKLFQRFSSQDNALVEQALTQVGMRDLARRPIGELSGGQRQRVYIARALAAEPSFLLLDEPTASVDPQVRTSIYELLRELNDHVTILMISHDMSAISSYVKTIGCLNHRLFYHREKLLTADMIESAYQCPIDLIAHGVPHRVLPEHHEDS